MRQRSETITWAINKNPPIHIILLIEHFSVIDYPLFEIMSWLSSSDSDGKDESQHEWEPLFIIDILLHATAESGSEK